MKREKNGFTLVELMGVIVILGVLVTVAVPAVMNISRKIKVNMYCTKLDFLENSAETWGQDHYGNLTAIAEPIKEGQTYEDYLKNVTSKITVKELVDSGYYKKDKKDGDYIVDPRNESTSLDDNIIYVYTRNTRVYAYIAPIDATCE